MKRDPSEWELWQQGEDDSNAYLVPQLDKDVYLRGYAHGKAGEFDLSFLEKVWRDATPLIASFRVQRPSLIYNGHVIWRDGERQLEFSAWDGDESNTFHARRIELWVPEPGILWCGCRWSVSDWEVDRYPGAKRDLEFPVEVIQ